MQPHLLIGSTGRVTDPKAGEKIAALREKHGLTLAQMGFAMGTSRQSIWKLERGLIRISGPGAILLWIYTAHPELLMEVLAEQGEQEEVAE